MARRQRNFTPEFKAKVVLDTLVTGKSLGEASREYNIKDSVLSRWRSEFLERVPMVFERGAGTDPRDEQIDTLERMLGRLTIELEMVKKVSTLIQYPRGRNGRS